MRDPDLKVFGLTLPPKGSNEFIKLKRSTRNSISKPPLNVGLKSSKKVSFKAGKGSVSVKDMDGLVYDEAKSDGRESKEEGFKVDLDSSMFSDSQSVDSRCCSEPVTKKEIQVELEKDMVGMMDEITQNSGKASKPTTFDVNDNVLGPMHVPVEDNPILNPRNSPVTSPRILKIGDVLSDGSYNVNATFSFNNAEKWPKLGNVGKGSSGVKNFGMNGISTSGNNKLKCIPVSINECGKKVVNLDPVLENGSKAWVRTLVGYFVDGISRISSVLGNLIIMHRITTSMCEKAYGRASFARVLIEVDANKGLMDSIEVCYESLGRSMMLRVEYLWKPPICSQYNVFGHSFDKCLKRELTNAEKLKKPEVNIQSNVNASNDKESGGEWKTVNNRRGGYGGRGRCMNRRGYGDQRYARNEGAQVFQVKKSNVVVRDNGKEKVQEESANDKMNTNVNGMSSSGKKKVGN
ncbi:hypothetical protein Tco_1253667 [Tanacetum coccineum]